MTTKYKYQFMNLVKTMWLTRYPRQMEITYDQVSEFIGHEFNKSTIETEYWKTAKPNTSGNSTSNAILEQIHQVLGNLVHTFNISETYFDKYDPWLDILSAVAFKNISTTNGLTVYSTGQLVFVRDIVIPIIQKVDWELIRHKNHAQINKDNIRENNKRVNYNYKVGDKVMINNHATYKYEMPHKGPFVITQC